MGETKEVTVEAEVKEYAPDQWERTLAHIQVVSNDRVSSISPTSECFAVFLNSRYIGVVKKRKNEARWFYRWFRSEKKPGWTRDIMNAVYSLIRDDLEKTMKAHLARAEEKAEEKDDAKRKYCSAK